jgi:phosphoribosylformimino-5-aminoimidazole carboxamide ribotide isomerase
LEVIPSIDLRGGRVVRLYQGDYDREITYSDDPVAVALRWENAGAPRIHVVDLDGATTGLPVNLAIVEEIVSRVGLPVQVGGGIRDMVTAERLLSTGVQRVVFGTAAIRDPALVRDACRKLGAEHIVVGIDARDGRVAVQGWTESSDATAADLANSMAVAGVARFIYTDIGVDGTLAGPNLQAVIDLMKAVGKPIISAGGIGSLADLEQLDQVGVEGVILGSALYRGRVDLSEAVRRFGGLV